MFTPEQVSYEALLDTFGGQEYLELMINARDFAPIYCGTQGLSFTFKVAENDKLRLVRFVPMAHSSTNDSFYAPVRRYTLRMTIETLNGLSFELAKPYHCVDLTHPENMVKVFETAANLTVTFH
jgi:hypothetical protein